MKLRRDSDMLKTECGVRREIRIARAKKVSDSLLERFLTMFKRCTSALKPALEL
jgi:hypothetical protein